MSTISMLPLANISSWLTPVWILAVGATLGLAILLALYGVVWLARRNLAEQIPQMLREGVFLPVVYLLLFLAGIALVAAVQMPCARMWASAQRIGKVGPAQHEKVIAAAAEKVPFPIEFRSEELALLEMRSDQDLLLYAESGPDANPAIELQGGELTGWAKGGRSEVPLAGDIHALYVTNEGTAPAKLSVNVVTEVAYPQVYAIPITALCVVGLFLFYFAIRLFAPRLSAIADTTARQGVSHPFFAIALAMGAVLLIFSVYLPYNTFGEDVKFLKMWGMTIVMVLSIFVALWTASISVAEEIEGRTALTLLSKPVSRRQFVFGKFLGTVWPVVLLFIFLGGLFLVTVAYKVVYDARETSKQVPEWQQCYYEMIRIVPGLALSLMEAIVLASISVAISTRVPVLANLTICAVVYVLGHLIPLLVDSGRYEIVRFVGLFIATIFPVLDHYKTEAAVAGGVSVPLEYLGWAMLSCLLYCSIMMALALFFMEDRDLA